MSYDNLGVYNVRHLILAHLSGQVPLICCSEKFDFPLKHTGGGAGVVEFVVMIFVDQTILNYRYTRFLKVTLWGKGRSGPVVNAIPNLSFPSPDASHCRARQVQSSNVKTREVKCRK